MTQGELIAKLYLLHGEPFRDVYVTATAFINRDSAEPRVIFQKLEVRDVYIDSDGDMIIQTVDK